MEWLKHIFEWFKASPRYFFPIAVASGFILFCPSSLLSALGILPVRVDGQPYLGVVFLFSVSVIVCDWAIKLIALIDLKYRKYKILSNAKSRLHRLTTKEKAVLQRYLKEDTRTQTFNYEDGVVAGLVEACILYPAVKVADIDAFPVNMKFPIWQYLSAHPKLVEFTNKTKNA